MLFNPDCSVVQELSNSHLVINLEVHHRLMIMWSKQNGEPSGSNLSAKLDVFSDRIGSIQTMTIKKYIRNNVTEKESKWVPDPSKELNPNDLSSRLRICQC